MRLLVEYAGAEFLHAIVDHILRNRGGAGAGDQLVDAVVDFRVKMVRTAAQHDNRLAQAFCFFNGTLTLLVHLCKMPVIFLIGDLRGLLNLVQADAEKILVQNLVHFNGEVALSMNTHIVVGKGFLPELLCVGRKHLGIICDRRAVVMVVAQPLVQTIRHTGIKGGVDPPP